MEHEPVFGRWLQQRRKALGLTQKDLAQRVGCSAATIRKLEAEQRRPSERIVEHLAAFLKIKEDERSAFLRFARGGWSDHPLILPEHHEPPPWHTPIAPNNLPAQLTELIGRERELDGVQQLLQQQNIRLLTLTGPGGTGKTRLGLEVAANLLSTFADGVFIVSLAPIREQSVAASTIAQALGVRETSNQSLMESLKEHLRDKQILLVLDNFEHIIEAAPVVSELLAACIKLKILVTSRERLRLRGEHEFCVPPLAFPVQYAPLEAVLGYPAVQLFIQRAYEVKPAFSVTDKNSPVVAEICARLDGLPLAIELAAARIKMFSPQAMLTRLKNRFTLLTGGARDLPSRQQTLYNTITWSYELLSDQEKKLLWRLAVFIGGRTLEAVEAVCNKEGNLDVLEGLASLVDKNLLQQKEGAGSEPRFVMLETIHEYAKECLEVSGEAEEMHRRHAQFFLAMAEEAEPQLRAKEQAFWLRRLEEEHGNLRTALRWLLDHEEGESAPRLASALGEFWYLHGHLKEGQRWLTEALPMAETASLPVRAKTFLQVCNMAWKRRDLNAARALAEQCLAICRELKDQKAMADAFHTLGNIAMERGKPEEARTYYEESLTLRRAQGDKQGMSVALNGLGESARLQQELQRAAALYEESLVLAREIGDFHRSGIALHNLGQVDLAQGHYGAAVAHFTESLAQHREIGELYGIASQLAGLAGVAAMQRQAERAARLFGAAEFLFEGFGTHLDIADRQNYDRSLSTARAQLNESSWERAWQEGYVMSLEEAIAYALEETQ